MTRTKVLVADSLTIFRGGVRTFLGRESDFDVTVAASLDEVMHAVASESPDIALIDLDLPPAGGIAAVETLRERTEAHVIVWSFEPTREAVLGAVRAGADGYLHKEISLEGLVRSLRGVVHGEAPLSRDLASLLIDAIHHVEDRDRIRERLSVLSSRECEILACVARGARNRQIAQELTISEFTVKRHMQNILGKLEVGSRRAAGDFYRTAQRELPAVLA